MNIFSEPIDNTLLEERKEYIFMSYENTIVPVPSLQYFSKWTKLKRSMGWILRFIERSKRGIRSIGLKNRQEKINLKTAFSNIEELNKEELMVAERILYMRVQADAFPEEIKCLKNNTLIRKQSRLYSLSCIMDKDGLLRLQGRLDNLVDVHEDFKNPIILDPKHRITKLIIQHYHEEVHHHGQEIVVNSLRQKYWIIRLRQAVKRVWTRCQKCKNRKASPNIPIMGQLPPCRLEPTIRPFVRTGVDYFGPIMVTVKRSHEKRYGVIFTCMATRAVHLEIAQDLSTDSFIHVLRQFGCRRGFPEELFSDNGSNFKSTERELGENLEKLSQTEIKKFCSLKNISWKFNPPSSPNMGGAWERLIQVVKKVMKEILQVKYPHEYVLRTVFAEIENILNSRPLTHVSLDSDDSEPLTPNHFLIGPSYAAMPCADLKAENLNLLSKWKSAQKFADLFWERWTREYLPYLTKRSKWQQEAPGISKNDVVIIVDPNGPRNTWPKGRVINLYPGKDNRIRIVDVQLANGTILRRPVSRLCILDIQRRKEE